MTMFTSSPGSSLMVAMIYCIVISRIKLDGL
jgi:pyruvate/2-oxoacid:ferredoxin oxidoreductase alpha subunit